MMTLYHNGNPSDDTPRYIPPMPTVAPPVPSRHSVSFLEWLSIGKLSVIVGGLVFVVAIVWGAK